MKKDFTDFLKSFTLYVFIIGVISYAISLWLPEVSISEFWPWILVFQFGFTLFVYWQLVNEFRNRLSKFSNTLMLVNFGKMFLYIIIIMVVAWFNRAQAPSFAITFLVYYALVTFFEIKKLLQLK